MRLLILMSLICLSATVQAFEQCSYKASQVAFRMYQFTEIQCSDKTMIDRFREARINIKSQYGDWDDTKNSFVESLRHYSFRKNPDFEKARDQYYSRRIRQDKGSSQSYRIWYPDVNQSGAVEKLLIASGYRTVDHITYIKLTDADRINPSGRVDSSDRASVDKSPSRKSTHSGATVSRQ